MRTGYKIKKLKNLNKPKMPKKKKKVSGVEAYVAVTLGEGDLDAVKKKPKKKARKKLGAAFESAEEQTVLVHDEASGDGDSLDSVDQDVVDELLQSDSNSSPSLSSAGDDENEDVWKQQLSERRSVPAAQRMPRQDSWTQSDSRSGGVRQSPSHSQKASAKKSGRRAKGKAARRRQDLPGVAALEDGSSVTSSPWSSSSSSSILSSDDEHAPNLTSLQALAAFFEETDRDVQLRVCDAAIGCVAFPLTKYAVDCGVAAMCAEDPSALAPLQVNACQLLASAFAVEYEDVVGTRWETALRKNQSLIENVLAWRSKACHDGRLHYYYDQRSFRRPRKIARLLGQPASDDPDDTDGQSGQLWNAWRNMERQSIDKIAQIYSFNPKVMAHHGFQLKFSSVELSCKLFANESLDLYVSVSLNDQKQKTVPVVVNRTADTAVTVALDGSVPLAFTAGAPSADGPVQCVFSVKEHRKLHANRTLCVARLPVHTLAVHPNLHAIKVPLHPVALDGGDGGGGRSGELGSARAPALTPAASVQPVGFLTLSFEFADPVPFDEAAATNDSAVSPVAQSNYHAAYLLLLGTLLDANGPDEPPLLSDEAGWLLSEFSARFGVHAAWRNLAYLSRLVAGYRQPPSADYLFVLANCARTVSELALGAPGLTKSEWRLFDRVRAPLVDQLSCSVRSFRDFFPMNEPAGALANAVEALLDLTQFDSRSLPSLSSSAAVLPGASSRTAATRAGRSENSSVLMDSVAAAAQSVCSALCAAVRGASSGAALLPLFGKLRAEFDAFREFDDAFPPGLLASVKSVYHCALYDRLIDALRVALPKVEFDIGLLKLRSQLFELRDTFALQRRRRRELTGRGNSTPPDDEPASALDSDVDEMAEDSEDDDGECGDDVRNGGDERFAVRAVVAGTGDEQRSIGDEPGSGDAGDDLDTEFRPHVLTWLNTMHGKLRDIVTQAIRLDKEYLAARDQRYAEQEQLQNADVDLGAVSPGGEESAVQPHPDHAAGDAHRAPTGLADDGLRHSESVVDVFKALGETAVLLGQWRSSDPFVYVQLANVAVDVIAAFCAAHLAELSAAVDSSQAVHGKMFSTTHVAVILNNLWVCRQQALAFYAKFAEQLIASSRLDPAAFDVAQDAVAVCRRDCEQKVATALSDARNELCGALSLSASHWLLPAIKGGVAASAGGQGGHDDNADFVALLTEMFEYLDAELDTLWPLLYPKLFQVCLRLLFVRMVATLSASARTDVKSSWQARRCGLAARNLCRYFHGNGRGLSSAVTVSHTRQLQRLLELFDEPSRTIIDLHANTVMKIAGVQELLEAARDQQRRLAALTGADGAAGGEPAVRDARTGKKERARRKRGTRPGKPSPQAELDRVLDAVRGHEHALAEFRECATFLIHVLEIRVQGAAAAAAVDKEAAAFLQSLAGQSEARHERSGRDDSHSVRDLFHLPQMEYLIEYYSCSWGARPGTLYLTSFHMCFRASGVDGATGQALQFKVGLPSIEKIVKRRFVQLQFWLRDNPLSPIDLSFISRSDALNDVLDQCDRCATRPIVK